MTGRATAAEARDAAWRGRARREVGPFSLALAIGVLLLAFLRLASAVTSGDSRSLDRAIFAATRTAGARSHSLAVVYANIGFHDLGAMGSISVVAFIVVTVSGLFLSLKRWREAAMLFLAGGLALATDIGLQFFFHRDRPPMSIEEAAGLNPSFPSGHAMMSATVYLTLAVLIGHFTERRFVRLYVTGVAMVLSLIVGVSRIYIGDHWFTDVIGGWCIGCAWALFWWGVAMGWERLSRRKLSVRSDDRR